MLKTLIIENHNNLTDLQRAEQRTEVDNVYAASQGGMMNSTPLDAAEMPHLPLSHNMDAAFNDLDNIVASPLSSSTSESESENEDIGDMHEITAGRTFSGRRDIPKTDRPSDKGKAAGNIPRSSAGQQLSTCQGSTALGVARTSTLLLQMIPYRASGSIPSGPSTSNRLISAEPISSDLDAKLAMEEATKNVRLLLDKWTTTGSAPVADILEEEPARESKDR